MNVDKELIGENKMNKYEKALYEITRSIGNHGWFGRDVTDVLQELVDKETPMKPKICNENSPILCPNCWEEVEIQIKPSLSIFPKRCDCGQRIDWGEDDGK